jgi:hypothetical protein
MYTECYEVDGAGNKVKDDDASKQLDEEVYKVDRAKFDQMITDMESIGDAKFDEVAQMYKQLGFQGFKENV